MKITGLWNCV